jgi:nucleotidyltransferase substrate binding protein (TIGR01987 family)
MTPLGPEQTDVRWKQRFENLQRALRQLEAAVTAHQTTPTDELITIALIKAYEFSFELSWKTLKDLLAWNGIDARLPRDMIKQAFANGLLENGQLWIDMLEQRNLMTHTYDQSRAEAAARLITSSFLTELQWLRQSLLQRLEAESR